VRLIRTRHGSLSVFPLLATAFALPHVRNRRRPDSAPPLSGRTPTSGRLQHTSASGCPNTVGSDPLNYLADGRQASIPDRVAFRIDFPAWVATLTPRDRGIVESLARGVRAAQVARKFHLSPGCINRLRRQWDHDWRAFCGDAR